MKGELEEVISRARYSDNPDLYTVVYRDGKDYPEVTLNSFINAVDADGEAVEIPMHRIVEVRRQGATVWKKRPRDLLAGVSDDMVAASYVEINPFTSRKDRE